MENGEVHKEQINVTIDADDVTVVDEKPGLKLKKLREELQNQMAQRRSEQWQQKIKDLQDSKLNTYANILWFFKEKLLQLKLKQMRRKIYLMMMKKNSC